MNANDGQCDARVSPMSWVYMRRNTVAAWGYGKRRGLPLIQPVPKFVWLPMRVKRSVAHQ